MPRYPLSRRVVCPSCAAPIGSPCVTENGEPFAKQGSHHRRAKLAAEEPAPEMVALLLDVSAAVPDLSWRLDGSNVVADRGGHTVRVTASRVRIGEAVYATSRPFIIPTLRRALKETT